MRRWCAIDTICRDCVFAEWQGSEQINCKINRLEKFQDVGTELVKETNESGKTYFRIMGRICNTCRHSDTLDGVPSRKWAKQVREEVRVRVAMAVYVDADSSYEDAIRSLDSIYQQTVKPREVIVIYNNQNGGDASKYANWLWSQNDGITWKVESIKVDADMGTAIDYTMKPGNLTSTFFTVCHAGAVYTSDYIEKIDKSINDDLERFVALLPDKFGNGALIQVGLHNMLQGNKHTGGCANILEKIQVIAEEENTGHMIKRLEDL